MAGDSFLEMWRAVRLSTGNTLPVGLAHQYVRNAYRAVLESNNWSMMMGRGNFFTHKSISGTCSINRGSNLLEGIVVTTGINGVEIYSGGSGYQAGNVITVFGGIQGTLTVVTVDGLGAIETVTITTPGVNYSLSSNTPTYGGDGSGATVNVTALGPGGLPGDNTTLVGRQVLFQSQSPIYNIVANADASTLQIDQPYAGVSTVSIPFEVSQCYFMPEAGKDDFERLICMYDPVNNYQLPIDVRIEELNNEDPQRSSIGDPWLVAELSWNNEYLSKLPTGVTDQYGRTNTSRPVPMKEIWPRTQSAHTYPYYYKARIADLVNPNDRPAGFIRSDIIIERALAMACRWPGTASVPNPAYDLAAATHHEGLFQELLYDARYVDSSVTERSYSWIGTYTRMRYPPQYFSARFIQNHVGIPGSGPASWAWSY